jgi:arylsulfatase A-like enzyme
VTLTDLTPTILELCNLEVPDSVESRSVLPLVRGETETLHEFIISSWPLYNRGESFRRGDDWAGIIRDPLPSSIHNGEWFLIYSTEGEPVELYHIPSDPKLENNVFDSHHDMAREFHGAFITFLENAGTDEFLITPRRNLPGS